MLKKIAVTSAGLIFAATAVAQATPKLIKPGQEVEVKQVRKVISTQADFGGYKVEREMAYVPVSQIGKKQVITQTNSMAIVESSTPKKIVNKNTVVRNLLTGELAPVSGNINVLLKKGVSADKLRTELGLTLVVSYPNTQLAVFKASEDADLIAVADAIKSSGLVSNARIEVLETIYSAD
ncbi:MAG: hypothetical protein OQJ89_11300 [Kangiellaceae bacterium]|nr:hypothetical protein [Kangiellaceae bacterium]MCW8997969.1 hypothetical protein [Kangiellaceae bacterium]MCW9017544.1 hypothetical protein [Kangiellaceae bacterium]